MESNPIRTHSEATRLVKAQGELPGLLACCCHGRERSQEVTSEKKNLLILLSRRKVLILINVAQISVKSRKTSKYVLITKYF
jgi:hypothetical protein